MMQFAFNEKTFLDYRIYTEKTVSSTNDIVMKAASDGEREGFVLIADGQTGGKGSKGRSFFSPPQSGVYMSLLLRPSVKAADAVRITTAAANAVCDSLEKNGCAQPRIKWVNDVYVNGKKVCGILTQGRAKGDSEKLDFAVLGVGMNLFRPKDGFPDEIADKAGFVFEEYSGSVKEKIIGDFLVSFDGYYHDLSGAGCIAKYRERCMVTGKKVSFICGEKEETAMVNGIDDDFSIVLERPDGSAVNYQAGEISIIF